MKNFVLIGVVGFVAPRYMKDIKDVGGGIIAILKPNQTWVGNPLRRVK